MEDFKSELPVENTKSVRHKRQGKSSREKNVIKYRTRKNEQACNDYRSVLEARLKLFEMDGSEPVRNSINAIGLTSQLRSTPLTVTTRGVGFATAIFYDRATTTWSLSAIMQIATIHQIYRVHLWLCYYKTYLAQQIQVEPVTVGGELERIYVNDEYRAILDTVAEVPSLMSVILDSVGKIQMGNRIFHMGFKELSDDDGMNPSSEYCSLVITPMNIRTTLTKLTNGPAEWRADFMSHNSIPGLRMVGTFLQNIDDVYPAQYTLDNLKADVHAYKNLLTRVQPRLPRHSIVPYSWHGKATPCGLWCGERSSMHLKCSFTTVRAPTTKRTQRLNDAGEMVSEEVPVPGEYQYQRSIVSGSSQEYYCIEQTPEHITSCGIASMVGEACFLKSREPTEKLAFTVADASALMYAVSDAPR